MFDLQWNYSYNFYHYNKQRNSKQKQTLKRVLLIDKITSFMLLSILYLITWWTRLFSAIRTEIRNHDNNRRAVIKSLARIRIR